MRAAGPSAGSAIGSAWPTALLAIGVGAAVAFATGLFMGRETALALLLGALVIAPVLARVWGGEFDLFEPATIIAGVYFVYFVFAPLVRFATNDMSFIGRDFSGEYVRILAAVFVAVAAMWLGYAMPVGPEPAPPGASPSPVAVASLRYGRRLGAMLVIAAVLGMIAWARLAGRSMFTFFLPGLVKTADEGGGTDIAYLFLSIEWFVPATVVLIACGGLRGRLARALLLLFVTVVYVSIGFRYRIVILWLATAIAWYLRAGRRPRLRVLAVPGVLAFLAAGWVAQARMFFRSGGAQGALSFSLGDVLNAALSDTRIFETFAAVMDVVPRFVPYAGAAPFYYPLVLPIPRFLWPGKPTPDWLTQIQTAIGTPESGTAGAAVPHFGEYYVAFGWPGIAVGMFVFGVGMKWLWRYYRAAPNDPWRQAVFALNAALIFQAIIRGYLAQIVQEWGFLVFPALVIGALARRRARRALGGAAVGAPGFAGTPGPAVA